MLGWVMPLVLVATNAFAETKDECIAASENAQKLRDQHKLTSAREQFLACARGACPDAVRQDCTDQAQKVADLLPTVIVRVKQAGGDIVDATVSIDGAVATQRLDGTPVAIDPGVHVVRVEAPRQAPLEHKVVVLEGEHGRVLDFSMPSTIPSTPASHRGFPVVATVFTGLAIAAFGVFGTFAVLGANDFDAARHTCSPTCSDATVDPIRTKLLVADIGLGAGIATGLTAIILYIAHYASGSPPSRAASRALTIAF